MESRVNTFDRKTRDDYFLLKEAMLGFIQDLEIGNRTEKSIHNVRSTFRELLEHAEVQQWPRLTEVGKAEIRTLLVELKTRPKWQGRRQQSKDAISDSYYETLFRRLKRFLNWCVAEGYMTANPMAEMPHPKVPKRIIPVVSDEDFQRLRDEVNPSQHPPGPRRFLAVRNLAVLMVLIDTPARKAEVTGMQMDHVDLEGRRLLVDGKGRKQRTMPIGRATARVLKVYRDEREGLAPSTGDWWVNSRGESLGENWVYQMLKRIAARAGVEGMHPHRFRHTFSKRMVGQGVPLPILEIMAGWVKAPATYLAALDEDDVRDAHRRVSPGDRLWAGSLPRVQPLGLSSVPDWLAESRGSFRREDELDRLLGDRSDFSRARIHAGGRRKRNMVRCHTRRWDG